MNSYLLLYATGSTDEVEAEFYESDEDDWVFMAGGSEMLRVPVTEVVSISKAR